MGRVDKAKTFVGDTPAKASEVNTVFDDIYNEFNGSVDEYNLNLDRPELKAALGDLFYPVGSKYTNFSDSTNPSILLGFGTWERIAEGKVVVGVDSTDTDFDTAEATGGEKTHTLTESEMPSHNHNGSASTDGSHTHDIKIYANGSDDYTRPGVRDNHDYKGTMASNPAGSHSHTITIGNTGGGSAHNNLQPYITAYIWKRTA
jgi:hypothetical protein